MKKENELRYLFASLIRIAKSFKRNKSKEYYKGKIDGMYTIINALKYIGKLKK